MYVNFFHAYAPSYGWGLGADVFEMSVEASIFWTVVEGTWIDLNGEVNPIRLRFGGCE